MNQLLSGLNELLGGWNALRRIDTEGFDWREKAKQAELARQQQQETWDQANQDWAATAGGEAAAGGATPEDIAGSMSGRVNNALTRARISGKALQSKSALAAQKAQTDAMLLGQRGAQAQADIEARGRVAEQLLAAREKVRADQTMSPRDRDMKLADFDRAIAVMQGQQAGATSRIGMGQDSKILPLTTTDASGNAIQTYITGAKAREMATGNAGAGATGLTGFAKPRTGQIANRDAGAQQSLALGNGALEALRNPKVQEQLGPLIGRYGSLKAAAGAGDPIAVHLISDLGSFAKLQLQVHGSRAKGIADDVEKLMTIGQTPEALAAALDGTMNAARVISGQSYHSAANAGSLLSEAPVEVHSRADVDAVDVGQTFRFNGRLYRKTGQNTQEPVQ